MQNKATSILSKAIAALNANDFTDAIKLCNEGIRIVNSSPEVREDLERIKQEAEKKYSAYIKNLFTDTVKIPYQYNEYHLSRQNCDRLRNLDIPDIDLRNDIDEFWKKHLRKQRPGKIQSFTKDFPNIQIWSRITLSLPYIIFIAVILLFLYIIVLFPSSLARSIHQSNSSLTTNTSISITSAATNALVTSSEIIISSTLLPTATETPTSLPLTSSYKGRVTNDGVIIRSEPGSTSTDTKARFNANSPVKIVGRGSSDPNKPDQCVSRDWLKIELPSIGEGWICADFVTVSSSN